MRTGQGVDALAHLPHLATLPLDAGADGARQSRLQRTIVRPLQSLHAADTFGHAGRLVLAGRLVADGHPAGLGQVVEHVATRGIATELPDLCPKFVGKLSGLPGTALEERASSSALYVLRSVAEPSLAVPARLDEIVQGG
jgi:hypothetical protein